MIQSLNYWYKFTVGLTLLAVFIFFLPEKHFAQDTSSPPDEWGPVSISLEDIPYPHPVEYFEFSILGEDVRMAYMDVAPTGEENGRTVVLLHGLNFFGEYWDETIAVLSDAGFRVVVPDQIGFGRSSKPIIPYSFQKKAANTYTLLNEIGVDHAVIIGHSMGGMLATRFAFSYPNFTEQLVLVNMIGKQDFRKLREWESTEELYRGEMNRTYEDIRQQQENYYVNWDQEYEKYIRIHYGWQLSPEWPRLAKVRAINRQMVYSQPVVYEFPHIEVPALILSGEKDGTDFPEHAQTTCNAIPDCRLRLLENIGHNPHLEAPEEFHSELLKFLNE
ncbi:alpha/beta hydrolase [Rhodohalobacter sp. SW132]|uniref:alpha/beta fold hydrolase n=1 Tax=Rhodohalobacter sp. SW132 TaxID=2293433 RepID=UPI000E265405|nr:alpha/beta hydrolase [Rhodohalobacter sp. SW132]REL39075.1 alpha/beta hydrolase [Rhodohalobacter sp. SW132]